MSDNPYASPSTSPSVPPAAGTMRLRRIGVLQTAKFLAVMYAVLGLIIAVPIGLIAMAAGGNAGSGAGIAGGFIGILIAPVLYGIGGFIGGAIAAFIYNLVAGWVGGIEFELQRG